MAKRTDLEWDELLASITERRKVLEDRAQKIFSRVTSSHRFAQPVHDDPIDRMNYVKVFEVFDLIQDLTLLDMHLLLSDWDNLTSTKFRHA